MSSQTTMSIASRYEYLQQMQTLYRQATRRADKSRLLDAMEAATGYHRKYLIQKMGETIQRQPRQRERGNTYGAEVDAALRLIWQAHDYICPERLSNTTLLRTARTLARAGQLTLPPSLAAQLEVISASTVRRHLPAPHPRSRPSGASGSGGTYSCARCPPGVSHGTFPSPLR